MLALERVIHPDILNWIKKIPQKAHPMGVLRTMVSLLGLFDPDADSSTREGLERISIHLIGAFPTIIAALYRIRKGLKILEPDMGLSHAGNFYYMMHGKKPEPEMERALDAYLILLADHGLNASTFSGRVTSATLSDMYSGVTSAVGTLKGDLHGSANQRSMEMILEIGTPERAESYILHLLEEKKKVMGFGHRIYKHKDPRATAFRSIAEKLCQKTNQMKWLQISDVVERVMWDKKQIPCNVDFFSASVLYILGFPISYFTTVFAASRVAGWTMHIIEQLMDNRLIRPEAIYTGPADLHYIPIEKRSH
jgi:citrate synthase